MAKFIVTSIIAVDNRSFTVNVKDGIDSEYTHIIDFDKVDNWYYTDADNISKKHEIRTGVEYEVTHTVKGNNYVHIC